MEDGGIGLLLFRAQTCESMECYEEMREVMNKLTKLKVNNSLHLSLKERNLLSVAYKNSVSEKRSSLRILSHIESQLVTLSDAKSAIKLGILLDYKKCVVSEIVEICAEMIDLVDSYLLTPTHDDVISDELFYMKMKADFYRFLVEVETGVKKEIAAAVASKTFETILEITFSTDRDPSLPMAHPIRIGMGLSYAMFLYEIYRDTKFALETAERTVKLCVCGIQDLSGHNYKESCFILDLLKGNIAAWKTELEQPIEENID